MSDDIDRLAQDLGRAPATVIPLVMKTVAATLHDIKTDAQADAPSWSGRYARSISYDHVGLRGEVGPESRYGHLVEDGGARSAPNPVMARAAKGNEDNFERQLGVAALQALGW